MQTSGLFTLHKCTIPVPAVNESIRLVFFGDVHRDSPNFADSHWQDFLAYAKGLKNAWFIGLGDYLDATSTSERECLSGAHKLHETIKWDLEKLTDEKVKMMARELDFMKGRIVGFLNGNHYYDYQSGINSDQKLCDKLGCKYLGVSSFIRITFTNQNAYIPFDIWAHHGAGGARLVGGDINRVDQMRECADADVFAMGHSHKRSVVPANPRLRLDNDRGVLKLEERQQWLLRTGSFLKAYEDGKVSYNVDAARGPCSLGHVELEVTWRRRDEKKKPVRWLQVRGIS